MTHTQLHNWLEYHHDKFNQPAFIENDPISVPHQFSGMQDIEIAGFFAAILAWGLRKTTINKCNQLIKLMDGAPHDFIVNHQPKDLKSFLHFKHRTFQTTDLLYFIQFFKNYYQQNHSLQTAFSSHIKMDDTHIGNALIGFQQQFFALPDAPKRTQKHIATPARNSTCKRLCMYLRWMVRQDDRGVDFGLWKDIKPSQLLCPFDVHVERLARRFNMINRKQRDWKTTLELTETLKTFDPNDPVKYDFALFGLGVLEKNQPLGTKS